MAKKNYSSAFNIINLLTNEVKSNRNLSKESDAFYFVSLKYFLGLDDSVIDSDITDLSYITGGNPKGNNRDAGIDAIHIDEAKNTIYLFNFKYSNKDNFKNFPSDETDKILSYIDNLYSYDKNKNYYFNNKLDSKTRDIINILGQGITTIKVILASNYYAGLENTKKVLFEQALADKGSRIFLEEFHLPQLIEKYLNRNRVNYTGVCNVDQNAMFPKKTNDRVDLFIFKMNALDLLKLFANDRSLRERKQPINDNEIVGISVDELLFEDNVRIFLTKTNKTNKQIMETARKSSKDFFFYNNGITIVCDKCDIRGGQQNTIMLYNYQVVNGGQTIHSLFETAKVDYKCLKNVDVLCRVFAGTEEDKKCKIARYTNSQTAVKERDLSSLDYVQKLLNEEFLLHNLYYERKDKQYKGQVSIKYRYDSARVGQLLLAFKLNKPNIARTRMKEVFSESYVNQIFDETISAEYIIQLYKLKEWLMEDVLDYKDYNKNSKLYIIYFYKLVYEKYTNATDEDILKLDYNKIRQNPYANSCKNAVYKILKHIIEKKKSSETTYDDSNYFKTEQPIEDFKNVLSNFDTMDLFENSDINTK